MTGPFGTGSTLFGMAAGEKRVIEAGADDRRIAYKPRS